MTRYSIKPDEARTIVNGTKDLLFKIMDETAALQSLSFRPGAFGQIGTPVAAGAEQHKLQQLQLFVKISAYLHELQTMIDDASRKLERADQDAQERYRGLLWRAESA